MSAEMRWTILAPADPGPRGQKRVAAKCSCGTERTVLLQSIQTGRSRSCGCLATELFAARARTHGLSDSPTYKSWRSMLARCLNPGLDSYPYYGGRGITVCDEWIESFDAFLSHVGIRPEGTTLDRIDNDGNYEPGNVRWATHSEQMRNRRLKETCKWGHSLLDESNVRIEQAPSGPFRYCLTCQNERSRGRRTGVAKLEDVAS